ncbi:mono/diheme cytochrome c family protein [Rhizobium etli]|uniref:Mono/diheme cytochrome c family protein n=2 Tax=Rhizobium etli TaxID=29449 RepID=A0A7W6V9K7_RHIET|nr:mono/diheme cytochrome c family protein [Rhizobium etli]
MFIVIFSSLAAASFCIMEGKMFRLSVRLAFLAASALGLQANMAAADDAQTARGEYLVTIGGCNDCHTPGYFFGNPDSSRFLGGSDVGFEIPGQGVFVGRNITPDKETGIGSWTREQIVAALQTGQRPDGRLLAPIMPWHAFAQLNEEDVTSIAAFLQSLKPVSHQVPGPFKPGEKVSTFMFRILPPGETAAAAPN